MKISNNKVTTLIYTLYISDTENPQEEIFEQATLEQPLIYCHGNGQMLAAFEDAMLGKQTDEQFDFTIPCEQAYGEYFDEGVQKLDKSLFFNGDDEFDEERVYEGAVVPMITTDGGRVNALILEISDKHVTIDLNHPLAGENLHFVGKIIDVRDATPDELDAIRHPRHCCGKKGKCHNNADTQNQIDCNSNCCCNAKDNSSQNNCNH